METNNGRCKKRAREFKRRQAIAKKEVKESRRSRSVGSV